MIDREQVLHVARLAHLSLNASEVDQMSSELSTILDHIEKISELDLAEVKPTAHVVEVQNAFRDDVPGESLEQEKALEVAPSVERGLFKVPSPGGDGE